MPDIQVIGTGPLKGLFDIQMLDKSISGNINFKSHTIVRCNFLIRDNKQAMI